MYYLASAATVLAAIVLSLIYSCGGPQDDDLQISDLSPEVQKWYEKGHYREVYGRQMFVVEEGSGEETVILIHGFPTSSFDYARSIDYLAKHFRVIAYDHLGFGFSEKPTENYTYSLLDQAEQSLQLWRSLGIRSAHVVAHDMGDSVLTEILTQYEKRMLPSCFENFFKSVTFTNGGMRYHLINMRLAQTLLLSPAGRYLSMWSTGGSLGEYFSKKQLATIWSPSYPHQQQMETDIANIQLINRFKEGNKLTYKTIQYLVDRSRFETRWLSSLARLNLPIMFFWGDSDAVAPWSIPESVAALLPAGQVSQRRLVGAGHFIMLEQPTAWADTIIEFVAGNTKVSSF